MNIFHLAVPTHNLLEAKIFYGEALGASIGREYPGYVIFDFFGHQLVTHLNPKKIDTEVSMYPRHFGIIFDNKEVFERIYHQAKKKEVNFYEDMFERFIGQPGQHWTFFLIDPSNNLIEFKYYQNKDSIFSK